MLDEADERAEDYRVHAAHLERALRTAQHERDTLLSLERLVRRWVEDPEFDSCAMEDALKPILAHLDTIRGKCRVCGIENVPEAQFVGERCGYCVMDERNRARAAGVDPDTDAHWAKPADQPATGPLRRKLALARGVLMQVLASEVGQDKHPSLDELDAIIQETADP
jgi:hypothetical protein